MKVTIGMNGATPIAPDYSMLKAALVAAQAATPTGRANRAPKKSKAVDPHEALHALFSNETSAEESAEALDHRFNVDAPRPEEGA
jgi:hypothetical protein